MGKSLWRWFATSRTAAIIVLTAGLVVGFHVSHMTGYSRFGFSANPLPYRTSFREIMASIVPIMILMGIMTRVSVCVGMRVLSLQTLWPGIRKGIMMASFLLWVLWLDFLLEDVNPSLYRRWMAFYDNSLEPLFPSLLLSMIMVYCFAILISSVIRVSRQVCEAAVRRETELDRAIRDATGSQKS